jgi:hypothetical protein
MTYQREGATGGQMKIGELRSILLLPFDCKWNGWIRDVTAELETSDEEVDQCAVFEHLILAIRGNAHLDRSFPDRSRIAELFENDERKRRIVTEDLSMFLRMMVTKHRRGKLDEEYCVKALDFLERHGLQGSVIRATKAEEHP